MGKTYGQKYDREMRETEHGSRLYQVWRRLRSHPYAEEWGCFPPFYSWAINSGYTIGARLQRVDDSLPYGPDNCEWYVTEEIPQDWADKWNKTVNMIRKHYGMPPLGGGSND